MSPGIVGLLLLIQLVTVRGSLPTASARSRWDIAACLIAFRSLAAWSCVAAWSCLFMGCNVPRRSVNRQEGKDEATRRPIRPFAS